MTAPTPEQLAARRASVEADVQADRAQAFATLAEQLRELPEHQWGLAIAGARVALEAREATIRAQSPPWVEQARTVGPVQGDSMGKSSDVLQRLREFRAMLAAPPPEVAEARRMARAIAYDVRGSFTAKVREVAVGGICPTCRNSGWLPRRRPCPTCRGGR